MSYPVIAPDNATSKNEFDTCSDDYDAMPSKNDTAAMEKINQTLARVKLLEQPSALCYYTMPHPDERGVLPTLQNRNNVNTSSNPDTLDNTYTYRQ